MTPQPQLLSDFFRLTFARELSDNKREMYGSTRAKFEQSLGHRATTTDFTPQAYFAFKSWLAERYAANKAHEHLGRLVSMWERAHDIGAALECPVYVPSLPAKGGDA